MKAQDSNYLLDLGVGTTTSGKLNRGGELILECVPGKPLTLAEIPYRYGEKNRGSIFISSVWENVESLKSSGSVQNSILGSAFECLISLVCCLEGIAPFYMQTELTYVPNSKFDILLYDQSIGPISLSIKTSLRERYKQADLEAMALKQVHRKSKSFLITLNENEANAQAKKIDNKDLIGLDKIILATSTDFDDLIEFLKECNLTTPEKVPVIRYRESAVESSNVKALLEKLEK